MTCCKTSVFLLIFGMLSLAGVAQKNDIAVSVNPLSFLEPDAGFTPGIAVKLGKKMSLLSDFGIIFYSTTNTVFADDNGATNTQTGYELRPEIRYYFKTHDIQKGLFISINGLYKHVTYHRYDGINVLDHNGNLVYTSYEGYKIIKDVLGGTAKAGFRIYFNKNYKLGFDIYAGIGVRNKEFAIRDLPSGGVFDRSFFGSRLFNTHWQDGSFPDLQLGFKLIYNFHN